MKRIDALGSAKSERLQALKGDTLSSTLDDTLQNLVRETAGSLGLPIALVSIVLERTQFFRAHVGLPRDLAVARATDRDASFCQFVVRDEEPFEVNDAANDNRLPQELVDRFGVAAYLGAPVRIGGQVVGSLCAIDTKTRQFSPLERTQLAQLAARVSERLEELAARETQKASNLMEIAAAPAFSEMRNILAPFGVNISLARVAAADIGGIARLAQQLPAETLAEQPGFASLINAATAANDLLEIIGDLAKGHQRLLPIAAALEKLMLATAESPTIAEVIDLASRLALHQTKLVGGVTWDAVQPGMRVVAQRLAAVSVLASALVLLADAKPQNQQGIRGAVQHERGEIVVELRSAGLSTINLSHCAKLIAAMLTETPMIFVDVEADAVRIRFVAASD
jgi:hypothetical protein